MRKAECIFLEDEKIAFTLSSFFTVFSSFFMLISLFDAEGLARYSKEGAAIILGISGANLCFSFEVDVLIDKEGLGKVK